MMGFGIDSESLERNDGTSKSGEPIRIMNGVGGDSMAVVVVCVCVFATM